ncbi:CvpA family protein [Parabacteroides johnsonii]|jgi:membrane protein required for colicin V production|uniref:CvpA family protein n=1 Tax=Parabacteroides johnsonii TaxID=387661 RepID=UPI00242E8512|nr:CvpA family protein [Parabacteroides johnsonii]
MNWLDITLLCLAGIGFVKGLFDGVIKQVVSLIALLVGIFFCTKAALWLRGYILALGWFPEQGVTVLSYVAGFLLIVGVILLAGEILTRVVGATPLSVLNHLVGGVLGLCFMMAFISLLLNGMEMIDKGSVLIPRGAKVESRFYNSVKEIIPTIYFQNLFFKEE